MRLSPQRQRVWRASLVAAVGIVAFAGLFALGQAIGDRDSSDRPPESPNVGRPSAVSRAELAVTRGLPELRSEGKRKNPDRPEPTPAEAPAPVPVSTPQPTGAEAPPAPPQPSVEPAPAPAQEPPPAPAPVSPEPSPESKPPPVVFDDSG